jgi:cytoskeletal protein CcmA (bactofilin family)
MLPEQVHALILVVAGLVLFLILLLLVVVIYFQRYNRRQLASRAKPGTLSSAQTQGDPEELLIDESLLGPVTAEHPVRVAAGVTIEGDLYAPSVDLAGTIRGEVTADEVTIRETGHLLGAVHARWVSVAGILEGDIRADEVEILETGLVEGNMTVRRLRRLEGGIYKGEMRMRGSP